MFIYNAEFEQLWLDEVYVGEVIVRERIEEDEYYHNCKYIFEDINKDIISKTYTLTGNDLLEDFIIMIYDEKIFRLWKKSGIPFIAVDFYFLGMEWNENISIVKFIKEFKEFIKNDNSFSFEYDDTGISIIITQEIKKDITIKEILDDIINIYNLKLNKFKKKNTVENIINFSREHLSAGMSILQYFGKILQEKYPNEEISVSIKQEGLKVTMLIDTSDGKKEEIEEYLNRYGMVVTNQITPQEFTSSPIQILELETKLAQAQQEIGFQKKLLALQDKTYDETLVSLKDEVKYLRDELSALRISNNDNLQLLLSSLLSKDKLIKKLTNSIEKRDEKETQELLLELKEEDTKGYISLKEHIDNIIVGNLTNTPAWMEFLITHFSK